MHKINQKLEIYFISFIISLLFCLFIVFIRSAPSKNEFVFNSMTEWSKGAYFNTNDFSNYFIGIIIFSVTPFMVNKIIYEKNHGIKVFIEKYKIYFLGLVLLIFFILLFNIPIFTVKITHIINLIITKKRGSDFLQDLKYIPLFLLLWILVFSLLKYKIKKPVFFFKWFIILKQNKRQFTSIFNKLKFPLIILLIIFLIGNPKYKYSFESLKNYGGEAAHQFHHVNFYLGPINEAYNGKMLMVNAYAQYGILSTYIPVFIFKLIGLSYSNFVLYNMLISFLYCLLFYLFLYILTKRHFIAFIGLIAFIRIAFFRSVWTNEIYVYPSSTPLRYIFDILMMISILKLYKNYNNLNIVCSSLIGSIAIFYNLEVGIPIIVGLLFSNFIYLLRRDKLNKIFFQIGTIAVFITGNIIFINLVTLILSGSYPDWKMAVDSVLFYSGGFFDIPAPLFGEYYIILGIYVYTYYYLLTYCKNKKNIYYELLVFILIYGILSFVYYLGFNEPHHLYTIAHPAVILFIYFIFNYYKKINNKNISIFFSSFLFSCLIAVIVWIVNPTYKQFQNITAIFYNRYFRKYDYSYWNNKGADFYLIENNYDEFKQSAYEISSFSDGKQILILSRYDTMLYIMTGKTSIINIPILEYGVFYSKELDEKIRMIKNIKPEFIYLYSKDYDTIKTDTIAKIWEAIDDKYIFIKHAGVIDVYSLIN